MFQFALGQGMESGLVVADLEQEVPAFFQDNALGALILAMQGVGGHGGVMQIDFGAGEEFLRSFEFVAFTPDIGQHGHGRAFLGIDQGDNQAQLWRMILPSMGRVRGKEPL